MKFNLLYKYTLIFIFSQAVLMYALSFFHTYSVESYNKMYIKDAKVKYNSTINTFKVLTDNFYDTHAKFIAFNMSKIDDANESKKALIRENILVKLSDFYTNEKLRNMEVFHIFEKNGRSFVRFHKEDKFGDYINLKRPSIDMLRSTFSSQIGIEIGEFKDSLRFQFPLFYNGDFVGLYEYGIAYDKISKEMQKILGGEYYYIIKKSAINNVVDNSVISKRYKISTIDKQYYELKSFSTNETINSLVEKLSKEKLITKNIEKEKTFASTLNLNNHPYTAVFLSIKDIFGKHISYYLIFEKGNYLKNLYTQLWSFYILFTLISIIILNKLFQTIKNTRFIETILDSQRDMIFFTDGKKMEQANQSILDFFNYPDLKSFTKEHDCICDFFISEDGYLQKRMGSES